MLVAVQQICEAHRLRQMRMFIYRRRVGKRSSQARRLYPVLTLAALAVPRCANQPTFSITTTAGLYSQLAGVLAGFAFTSLMLLTTASGRIQSSRAFTDATRILVASFLALILTSVNYAVLAGDPGTDGRTASEEPILGVGFAVAGTCCLCDSADARSS